MTGTYRYEHTLKHASNRIGLIVTGLSVLALSTAMAPAEATNAPAGRNFCSATANNQFRACKNEVWDEHFEFRAVCINLRNGAERRACQEEASEEVAVGKALCVAQRKARRELCGQIGEARYDPEFDPAGFESDFRNLSNPNPYFPLTIGHEWRYAGGDETIVVQVLDETKSIEGVTCIVLNDRVEEDGEVVEDTDDWYGQRLDGTVDYCGEISKNFELFEGDDPDVPELVDVEGSWKAGRDGAKAGTQFPAWPAQGAVYRQEWAPGDAEDVAKVLSTVYRYGNDAALDQFVPRRLAGLFCANADCIVTGEYTPIEPDVYERKYYAPGIGLFLEIDPAAGEAVELVDCNFDPRCRMLAAP